MYWLSPNTFYVLKVNEDLGYLSSKVEKKKMF